MTNNLNIFFQEVYSELSKIIWPSRKEFLFSVFFTLLVVVFFSIYLGLADMLIVLAVNKIIFTFL